MSVQALCSAKNASSQLQVKVDFCATEHTALVAHNAELSQEKAALEQQLCSAHQNLESTEKSHADEKATLEGQLQQEQEAVQLGVSQKEHLEAQMQVVSEVSNPVRYAASESVLGRDSVT